jgi:CDP-glucose 4,6-dehydratase
MAFNDIYKEKKVLVTGHTGFKGSWLTLWLLEMGAEVCGYSIGYPTDPCNFKLCNLDQEIKHIEGDVSDLEKLDNAFSEFKPDIVFHMAAQPLVRLSYDDPKLTFDTNIGGTINILECLKNHHCVSAAVMITSDKCYENCEWLWGYRESDRLGGADPYSASKAGAEIVISSYMRSFFNADSKLPKIASARAGNVIGGGDWASDRIVPDFAKSYVDKNELVLRSPNATRPWQHVLEPLSGYLTLGASLLDSPNSQGESFNFGPSSTDNHTVETLIKELTKNWDGTSWSVSDSADNKSECGLLQLNCDKASAMLNWRPVLHFEETVKWTADWYQAYINDNADMNKYTREQITSYISLAGERNIGWAV